MKLGLIGCGRMGRAFAIGAIEAGAVAASELIAYDVAPKAVEALAACIKAVTAATRKSKELGQG